MVTQEEEREVKEGVEEGTHRRRAGWGLRPVGERRKVDPFPLLKDE